MDPSKRIAAQKEIERRKDARSRILPFSQRMVETYRANWHHGVMASALDRWVYGDIKRLMIFAPPQHGKSLMTSKLTPAFIMGRNPNASVMCCSASEDLVTSHNMDLQKIMDSEKYRALFPETGIPRSGRPGIRNTREFEIVGKEGRYLCASIGGQIIGRGFDYGIIDDPLKNRKEAESFARRDEIDSWYQSTFRTRRKTGDSREVIISTRWTESDLCGRLLQRATENPLSDKWMVIRLANIRDGESLPYDPRRIGEVLWPARHPLSSVLATKATIDIYEWNSAYQQLPTPRGGSMFPEGHFQPIEIVERHRTKFFKSEGQLYAFGRCAWFQTIDTAMTASETADYTVIGTFALLPNGRLVVWHIFRARLEVPQQFPAIMKLRQGEPPSFERCFGDYGVWDQSPVKPWPFRLLAIFVEPKASGLGVIYQLSAKGVPVRALKGVDVDKVRRAGPVSTMWSSGMVRYNPEGRTTWVPDFASEVTRFPGASKKDQTDVLAYSGQVALYDDLIRAHADGLVNVEQAESDNEKPQASYTIDLSKENEWGDHTA